MGNDVSERLSVRGLCKAYRSGDDRVTILNDFDLSLSDGEAVALTGRSGSGKSTLIHLLCGLAVPDGGRIRLFGEAMPATADDELWATQRRQRVATVFQDTNLLPTLTVSENIRFRASLADRPAPDVAGWLRALGLQGLADRYPDQVSGGQRQRAAIAVAFAMRPELLLADEPTGSLDRHTASAVADELFRFQRDTGCPMLLATHDQALAERCERIVPLTSEGDV
ncbi:putative ABC transport system ATP-binding protein [Tamilnaduibacter salinus]|uniref:Putative ABC transport system ATP-binding protein n=1 Tax=Tamilnaduibacter salinus TaxID=1484056 RepID=A0A2U1D0X5_9GAMM|nr:ABC transporter ATP-binding protein [Tamilnaduibacter salinus]PVY79029.1 putative ABC transport system ATP-binding protein [Tamilnaduibacter salinus]